MGCAAPLRAVGRALVFELADHARALAARPRGNSLMLRVGRRLLAGFRQHHRLRRDEGGDPAPLGRPPDALGREARVGADRGELGAGEAGAVKQRLDRVALEAVRLLAAAGDDATVLAVDRDLAAIDEVGAMTGLVAQLRL